jgi:hypothetical protein
VVRLGGRLGVVDDFMGGGGSQPQISSRPNHGDVERLM